MPEVIQDWLGTRLGVLLDMSPKNFGRNTKDGKLLAKLLYGYGVIPEHILNNVKDSKNFYECHNNLIMLKPWLKYIGVTYDDSTLEKMAGGEGSAAISVFYAVYLNLERKDRLYYLSAQKEGRFSQGTCSRFKVDWVPESMIRGDAGDSATKLAAPLYEKCDMIQWHKANCKEIIEKIKETKARFRKVVHKERNLGPPISKHVTSIPLDKRQLEADETRGNITAFEKKHVHDSPDLNYSQLMELQSLYETQPCPPPSLCEAKTIVSNIKRRKKGEIYARSFQQKMQHILLDEQWREIIDRQDRDFEDTVCANLLKQSQYEKQMANKLCLMRHQKKVLAENRKKIECLKIEQCQKEFDAEVQRKMDLLGEAWENEVFEKERISELHRRLYDEKVRRRREEIRIEVQKIWEALVDISIRISEVRNLTGCQVPKSFMKDLKELFYKDLSIFDILDHFEELYDNDSRTNLPAVTEFLEEEEGEVHQANLMYHSEEYDCLKAEELERQSILDDCDFTDYLQLAGPWMVELLFPDGSETEVEHRVLGYIVHKLLSVKYPQPNVPVPVDIKPMKPAVVVLGLNEDSAINMLKDLMEPCRVLVVQVNDAINFVLSAYKEELSVVRDIDISFQKATDEALKQKNGKTKEKEVKKKLQLLKIDSLENQSLVEDNYSLYDKQTQTPRMIPEDDPLLSQNAELGKQAFEAMGVGDPVPDPVITAAIVAYVISKQEEYNGWVLLNYPLYYSQASDLEFSLTGFRTLPVLEDMDSREEEDSISFRGPWANPLLSDNFADNRLSQLVPKPDVLSTTITEIPKTYFDSFIKLKKMSSTPRRRSQDLDDIGPMEKFYSYQETLVELDYQVLSFQVMKDLGKEILKKSVTNAEEDFGVKTSVEIFGSCVLDLNEKWEPKKKIAKDTAGGVKKVAKESIPMTDFTITPEDEEEEEENVRSSRKTIEAPPAPPKPGDPNWEWVTGPQTEEFQLALASLWENMEAVYIEDFKNVFFCLRVHRSNVINYTGYIRKSVKALLHRSDDKQKVLSDFQQMFNEIDEDLRPDVDIKCELYVRVSELEQALMNIADKRKADSIADLVKLAQDGWVPDEMATLVNIFLTALQLEADRCIDSCQVIMDYYASIQQKIPEEKPLGKILVPKLQLQDRKYSIVSNGATKSMSSNSYSPRNSDYKRSNKSLSEQSSKLTQERLGKTRSFGDKRKRSSEGSFLAGAAEVIAGILKNLSLPEDGTTPFHTFFIDDVQLVSTDVKNIVEGCIQEAKKGDRPAPNPSKLSKNMKKNSEAKISSTNDNLVAEWTTALENELSRFTFRTQLILSRAVFELNEFLTAILNVLSSLMEDFMEMYLKEIHSISECCKVFRCAIEEEVQILPRLLLKEDEFIVDVDEMLVAKDEELVNLMVEDERKKFRFSVEQLLLLSQKLQKVAPDGEIIKRSLVFIFEDLRLMKPEVENGNCFPEIWLDIQPNDLVMIMDELYQDLEIVHWKDFIIYALEFPMPTEAQILSMRRSFQMYDPKSTELITRENYENISFWFEGAIDHYKEVERTEKAKDLLYFLYQVDELRTNYTALLLAFCKDENPVVGFTKALVLVTGKKISLESEKTPTEVSEFEGEDFKGDLDSYEEPSDDVARKTHCCNSKSSEMVPKCIPREKIVRCDCPDQKSSVHEIEEEMEDYPEREGENLYFVSNPYRRSSVVSIVPYNILSSLLKASFPSLPQLTVLLDCKQTFQETLNSIYDSFESYNGTVEVSKLVKHKFISRLLQCTNKFKFVKLHPILQSVAKFKPSTRVVCVSDKLNVNYCLRK